jgi:hypothetical protein
MPARSSGIHSRYRRAGVARDPQTQADTAPLALLVVRAHRSLSVSERRGRSRPDRLTIRAPHVSSRRCPARPRGLTTGSGASRSTYRRSAGSVVFAAGGRLDRRIDIWRLERAIRSQRRPENAIHAGVLGGSRRNTEHRNAPVCPVEGLWWEACVVFVCRTHGSALAISQQESPLLENFRRRGEEPSEPEEESRCLCPEASGERPE